MERGAAMHFHLQTNTFEGNRTALVYMYWYMQVQLSRSRQWQEQKEEDVVPCSAENSHSALRIMGHIIRVELAAYMHALLE